MRKISNQFMQDLQHGYLNSIIEVAINDPDINFEIRSGYISLYYKGHSLLNLRELVSSKYSINIHPMICMDTPIPNFLSRKDDVDLFIKYIPLLKSNIFSLQTNSLEMEYEQMIIRANNSEKKLASEYFILDRQYAIKRNRFDLMGFYWPHQGRRKNQTVSMCLMEVKYGLNADIKQIHMQLSRYYDAVEANAEAIAVENESILKQKLSLGIFKQPQNRLDAMKTLHISQRIEDFQFVIFLIDFNPYSSLLNEQELWKLPFANQIRLYKGGLALWQPNLFSKPTVGLKT
jgi:hypothetical protein